MDLLAYHEVNWESLDSAIGLLPLPFSSASQQMISSKENSYYKPGLSGTIKEGTCWYRGLSSDFRRRSHHPWPQTWEESWGPHCLVEEMGEEKPPLFQGQDKIAGTTYIGCRRPEQYGMIFKVPRCGRIPS